MQRAQWISRSVTVGKSSRRHKGHASSGRLLLTTSPGATQFPPPSLPCMGRGGVGVETGICLGGGCVPLPGPPTLVWGSIAIFGPPTLVWGSIAIFGPPTLVWGSIAIFVPPPTLMCGSISGLMGANCAPPGLGLGGSTALCRGAITDGG